VRKYLIVILVFITGGTIQAQTFTLKDLELQFLGNNISLIANKFNIDKADAEIVQEKLWQNPSLAISEVNLWKNSSSEELPYLFGKYGRYQQASLELEQLIETAGKRKKRVALKGLEKNAALFEYEELMRELKKELRLSYYTLERISREEGQLLTMIDLFSQMSAQYERQSALNNVRKADYYRIQTEMIGLKKEQIELENEKFEALNEMRILTNIPSLELNQIVFSTETKKLTERLPYDLVELAKSQNIGLMRQENEVNKARKQLDIEKAERTPNVTLQMNYDRGGNIMRDFIGVGASIDIPIFNRNKGNIKAAQLTIDQEKTTQDALVNQLEQSLRYLENQVRRMEGTIQNWPTKQMDEQLKMLDNYQKHLQNKEVTLMEFIDFAQSYREAKQAYLEIAETYYKTFEELQYIVGKDF